MRRLNISETGKKWICFILFLISLWGVFRYIFPLMWPFVIAILFVCMTDGFLDRVSHRFHFHKGILTGILLGMIIIGGLILCMIGISGGLKWMGNYVTDSSVMRKQGEIFYHRLSLLLERYFSFDAREIEGWFLAQTQLFENQLLSKLVPCFASQSISFLKMGLQILWFLLILWIATVLLSKDFNRIKKHFAQNAYIIYARNEMKKLGHFARTYLLAQCVIMSGIVFFSIIGFLITGENFIRSILLGVLTGALDVLPFLGTGIVLIPMAVWNFVLGNIFGAIVLIIIFIITVFLRELLEPKLVGQRMGLLPVVFLFAVYVGLKLFGKAGIILGPVYVIVAADFYFYAEIGKEVDNKGKSE